MTLPSYTKLSNAQGLPDPEKGQPQHDTVHLHGQPIGTALVLHDQRTQRSKSRRSWIHAFHWIILEVLFISVFLYTFKDLRNVVFPTIETFAGGPSDVVTDAPKPDLAPVCPAADVLPWSPIPVPPAYASYKNAVRTDVNLSLASDLLYFIGRGDLSHGDVRFIDSEVQDSGSAGVNVTLLYDDSWLPKNLTICRLHNETGKNGVGVFSPKSPNNSYHSTVLIEVKLPRSALVKSLQTHLPLFSQYVGDFRNSVTFGTINLTSTNLPIIAKYLTANQTYLHTTNSRIAGIFNSRQVIDIVTSNAIIEGDFNLSHDGVNKTPSSIGLRTRNAPIMARFYLTSTAENKGNGSFNITTITKNAPLNIKFESSPLDSLLDFKGVTSNGFVTARMNAAFEGRFTAGTGQWFPAGVHVINKIDPSGKGRTREVATNGSRPGYVEGDVTWGPPDGKRLGQIELVTTNSPVDLYL